MDIALENMNNAPRRFGGAPPQRNNTMPNTRPNMPNNNQQFEEQQQYQQGRGNNPRFTPNYPQSQQNQNGNYRSPPQRHNREEAPNYPPKQNYRQDHQQQQDYSQQRQPPPRYPPPPPREPRQQRQNQQEPEEDRGHTATPYQKPPRHDQEQGRFDRRQNYRQESNEREDDNRPHRPPINQRRGQQYDRNQPQYDRNQQQPNQRNQRVQPDRNYQQRQEQRQPPMQRGQYEERGRGRGRGAPMDRGRGRGRGRGRQISRAIQQSEFHNLPPVKKPQEQKAQQQSEQESASASGSGSGSESGSEQMSQEEYQSKSSHSQQGVEGSVMDRSESDGSVKEGSASEQQSGSEAQSSERPIAAVAVAAPLSPQSSASLNMQQIHTMCSREQFNERLQTFTTNNRNLQEGMMRLDTGRSFAIFEINKKTGEPDYALTLKRYRRSTNRSEDEDEQDEEIDLPRSRTGLMKAMAHIMKEIIDADNVKQRDLAFPLPPGEARIEFLHIFDFLWNRMREMIKDVSRLELKERSSGDVITICEQMLRFFIIATREGKLHHTSRLEFDPKLNLQSITKILTQLLEIYEEAHMKLHKDGKARCFISPNEPEIIAYAIIISNDIQKTLNQKLMVRLNGQGLDHPLLASPEIATALRVKKALKNRDYETYYQILEDDGTDYVLSCLLLHHLPIVRRETLRTIYRSAPTDPNKMKKISQEAFRHALRFKSKQHQDFKDFLREIRATISNENGQSFILLSQMEDSAEVSSILSNYLFDTNKALRNRYDLKPIAKRLSNPNIISREELTKRTWFQGKYATLAKRYYNSQEGEEEEQEQSEQSKEQLIPPIPSKREERKEPDVLAEKSLVSPVPVVDGNKINFLLMKRKELQRNRFLKGLEGLIQTLIKNSDIHSQHKRKKGLQTMLELTDLARVLALDAAFARLADFANAKRIAQQALIQLQKYRKVREEFENAYNRNPFQFQKRSGEKPAGKMSLLLNQVRRPKEQSLLKRLFSTYQEEAEQHTTHRRLRTLYIFTSDPRKAFTESQRAFLLNFFLYIAQTNGKKPDAELQGKVNKFLDASGETSLQFERKIGKTDEKVLDYSFTIFNYRSGSEAPFLSGYEAVVFIDLWKNLSAFHPLLRDFQENRKKLYKSESKPAPPCLQDYLVIHVGSGQGPWQSGITQHQRESSRKEQWEGSWHRLQVQAMNISPSLKITLTNFLSAQLRKPQPSPQQFAVFSFAQLIDQIERNLECVSGEQLKQEVNSLQFLEVYFNESLQCLRRGVMETALHYESCDWREILQEASFSRPPPYKFLTFLPPQELILHDDKPSSNPNSELGRKLLFSLEMLSSLRLTLSNAYVKAVREGAGDGVYVLSHLLENYLQGLQSREVEEHFSCLAAYVIQTNCRLALGETVGGDCKGLFLFLLGNLKLKLQHCTLILPRDFHFRIHRTSLIKQEQKQEEALVKSLLRRTPLSNNRKDLKYCRSGLLSQLLQEIQQEQDDEVVEVGVGKKTVKTR